MSLRLLPVFASLAALTLQAEEIRIAASDLLAEYIAPVIDAYSEEYEKDISVESIGTLPALERLRSNEVELAIIAVPVGQNAPRDEFRIYPFAYDVAVVVVNENNPITEISVPYLGGIYGSNEEYNFNSWGDLGVSGWGGRNIKPMAAPLDDSISLELFRSSVLSQGALKPSLVTVKDDEVEGLIDNDSSAIAILSRLPESEDVRVLLVSETQGDNSPPYSPTPDNIHFGDYPIRLPFYVAYHARDEALVAPVLRVLLDDAIAESLNKNHFFALPQTVRRKLILDLDLEK